MIYEVCQNKKIQSLNKTFLRYFQTQFEYRHKGVGLSVLDIR